jgi:uncharacterized protein
MILIDANLLVYAYVESQPQHRSIVRWLEDCLNGTTIVGLPWQSLLAFLRLVTNPRIFGRPATIDAGWAQIELWLSRLSLLE